MISSFPDFKWKVQVSANQSEDVNEKLMADCIKQSGNETLDEDEAALYILKELWNRLRETHRLRAVK